MNEWIEGKKEMRKERKYAYYLYIYIETDICISVSLVAQKEKNLPAMKDTQVQSPSQDGPLEKEMTTYSSFLAWEIPWTEKPGGLQFIGS